VQLSPAFARGDLRLQTRPSDIGAPRLRDEWAAWTVRHVPPPVAIVEGGELLHLALEEARAAGELPPGLAGSDVYRSRRPGAARDLDTALTALQRGGIGHILVDAHDIDRQPYLRDLYDPRYAGRVELVRSFRAGADDGWLITDMDVFRIR
jgi:hypothetical protein